MTKQCCLQIFELKLIKLDLQIFGLQNSSILRKIRGEPHFYKWVSVVNKYLSSELIKMFYRFGDSSFVYWQQFHGWLFYINYRCRCSLPWFGMCDINFMSKSPISAVKNYFLLNYQKYKAENWPEIGHQM